MFFFQLLYVSYLVISILHSFVSTDTKYRDGQYDFTFFKHNKTHVVRNQDTNDAPV